jgi:Flp pilus assembly protein TadG
MSEARIMHTTSKDKQRGSVAVVTAVSLVSLLGFAALAIDIGNLLVSRNELQNAADAAALAGAPCLFQRAQCGNTTAKEPDWTTATQKAVSFATATTSNAVQGSAIKVAQTGSGYWNITGAPGTLQGVPFTPGANDLPAISVTITKSAANANGSIPVFLASILGVTSLSASAAATAAVSRPGYVGPGGLFPIAISKCLYDNYWDSSTNSPKLATSTAPISGQTVNQTPNSPYVFQVSSAYQANGCEAGQWTTLTSQQNDVPFVRGLIAGQNTDTLGIGSQPGAYIQPGEKNTLFDAVESCSADGDHSCEYKTVPVVSNVSGSGYKPVVAFACVRILKATNGSNPYVLVQMSNQPDKCQAVNAGGVGPNYGAITPPRLVQ